MLSLMMTSLLFFLVFFLFNLFFLVNLSLTNQINFKYVNIFECGFDCVFWRVNSMSLHYFKIILIFIMFDLEFIFLIFLLKNSINNLVIMLIYIFIFFTLFLEIFFKSLKWNL